MEIEILLNSVVEGKHIVTFKYWKKGECACTAIKVTREFDFEPSTNDLLDSL